MIKNYLKIAVRNLLRHRAFTVINILGLSLGLACCILLSFYIKYQLSYDKHHANGDRLYLVAGHTNVASYEYMAALSAPYAPTLKADFAEIEQSTRLFVNFMDEKALLQVHEDGKAVKSFFQDKGYQVDSTFFDLFTYQFVEGSPRYAMHSPDAMVISEELAHKLFGNSPALNRTVQISGTEGAPQRFLITGVYKSEQPSHIDAQYFIPLSACWIGQFLRESSLDMANNNMFHTYIKLVPGADLAQLEAKFPTFIDRHAGEELRSSGRQLSLILINVADIHLDSRFKAVVSPTSSIMYLYILGSIALFTLVIACVNFMNLSTALSVKRASEVGMRKVLGAQRGALMSQFLVESVVLSILSLLASLWIVSMLLPLFNYISGHSFSFIELLTPTFALFFLGLALATGLLSGIYPALFLSGYKPALVLKGKFSNSLSGVALRKGLVVFQFFIALCLMVSTFIIEEQMQYLKNKPLGFVKDQQVIVPLRSEAAKNAYSAFRNELVNDRLVNDASGTDVYPGIANVTDVLLYKDGETMQNARIVYRTSVDYDYQNTMDFEIAQGRWFSRQFPADTNLRVVVNEKLLEKFEIDPESAVGKGLFFDWQGQQYRYEIIGVLKNFHFMSLHQPIQPYMFNLKKQPAFNYLVANIQMDRVDEVLASMEQKWKAAGPDEPFEYSFLDEDFQKNYQAEQQMAIIVRAFTGTAILISCLGLFGLAAFSVQQRTKEIGVRKVLGASVTSIVGLVSKDFIKLVGFAMVLAFPLAWYAMNRWLDDFAYRISVPWWVFVLSGGLAVAIAFLTVSSQAIKAAFMNPVKSLRNE
jgi:putative ABC transport system permease protein